MTTPIPLDLLDQLNDLLTSDHKGITSDPIWDAAGDLAIGTGPDAAARLAIGTAGQLLIVNAGATAPEWNGLLTIDVPNSRVGLGIAAPTTTFEVNGYSKVNRIGVGIIPTVLFEIMASENPANIQFTCYDDLLNDANIIWRKANGTSSSPTDLLSADSMGNFQFKGYQGGFTTSRAKIQVSANGNWTSTNHGTNLLLQTTPLNAIALVTSLSIVNNRVGIGINTALSKLHVVGSEDIVQLIVKANATQTANLQEWQNNISSVLSSVNSIGHLGITTSPSSTYSLKVNNILTNGITVFLASNSITGTGIAAYAEVNISNATNTNGIAMNFGGFLNNGATDPAAFVRGVYGSCRTPATNIQNYTRAFNVGGTLIANDASIKHLGSGTLAGMCSALFFMEFGGGLVTSAAALVIQAPYYHDGGACTNVYGLYINSISGGATESCAILTNKGNIVFNEGGDPSTDFRVEGDTATSLFFTDASIEAVQIGTTTAGAIADFRPAEIVFNDTGLATLDFRVESDAYDALFVDASNDSIDVMHHASGKIGFFAQTPAVQQSYTAVSNPPTQAEVTAIRDCLINLGLMKAS